MTAAQLLQLLVIIGLGILAFLTFIVAGTIMGLMIVEDSGCNCVQYPIGLYVLGILGLLLLIGLVRELSEAPLFTTKWITDNREALILTLLVVLAIIILLS